MRNRLKRTAEKRPRWLPRHLSARLTCLLAIGAAVTFILITSITALVISGYTRTAADNQSSALLAHIGNELALQARLSDVTVDAALRESASAPDTSALATTLADGLPQASAYVLTDSGGVPLLSKGDAGDTTALTEWLVLASPASSGTSILTALPSGPAVVTISSVPDDFQAGSGALFAAARPLTVEDPGLGDNHIFSTILVSALLALVAIGMSYAVSLMISKRAVRSLKDYTSYLDEQGYLALQGLRPNSELIIDERVPLEVADLGKAIKELLVQLRLSQVELLEVTEQATAAERAFRTVVEESPELKILVRGGVVEIANPAAAHFFGLQLGDLLRAEPTGLFSGVRLYDEEGTELELREVARLAREQTVVARCETNGQPDRWIELSVALIDSGSDDYVLSARNITEERRIEALRTEVMSLVSHDLRSPLTVVRGYIDILDRPIDDTQRHKALDAARRSTEHMEELLDDLLHATRAERVFAPRIMRPVNLGTLATSVATSIQNTAAQKITVTAKRGATVLGDPARLRQAISNLVGNAVKHGPEDGEIRVTVAINDGRVTCSVEDNGPGIPEDQWERLFERGTRGEHSAMTPGTGLGLYIVRVVAEAHNGSAYIEASGNTTRFVLELPIMTPDEPDRTA